MTSSHAHSVPSFLSELIEDSHWHSKVTSLRFFQASLRIYAFAKIAFIN